MHAAALTQLAAAAASVECGGTTHGGGDVLGWAGTAAALGLFAVPAITCRRIVTSGSLGDYDHLPYLSQLASTLMWSMYALPSVTPCKMQPLSTNLAGAALSVLWLAVFVRFAHDRARGVILGGIAAVLMLDGVLAAVAFGVQGAAGASLSSDVLGYASSVLNVLMYAAPLAIVRLVLRTRSVEYMPLGLTLAQALNSTLWLSYAVVVRDPFIVVPNMCGVALACLQLACYGFVAGGFAPIPKQGAREDALLKGGGRP